MALTVDSAATFGPGPHQVQAGPLQRVALQETFPGQDDLLILALGQATQEISQSGLLVASGATPALAETALAAIVTAVNAILQDATHTLADGFGESYADAVLMAWRMGPRRLSLRGSTWTVTATYEADWIR